MKLRVAMMH